MNIILTKTTDLDKFHYENIGRNYRKNKIFLERSNGYDKEPQMLTDIGQLLAYEQGARFIQSLEMPKEDRKITLIGDNSPERYGGTYQSNKMSISPHTLRLHQYCIHLDPIKKLTPFDFEIEPKKDSYEEIHKNGYFRFEVQKENPDKVSIVYQKPILWFGRGYILDTKTADDMGKILRYANTSETKAELRQEIFHKYKSVMQLVVEGEFKALRTDKQKNKVMKTIENLENKILDMGQVGILHWI